MVTSTRTRVLAAVISRGNQYLVCKRPVHKRHGGLWEFPGGKMEPGEDHLAAARRELAEELRVEAEAIQPVVLKIADEGSEFLIEFVPTVISGEPVCVEHSELRWLALTELQSVELAPSDRKFVEFLVSHE